MLVAHIHIKVGLEGDTSAIAEVSRQIAVLYAENLKFQFMILDQHSLCTQFAAYTSYL